MDGWEEVKPGTNKGRVSTSVTLLGPARLGSARHGCVSTATWSQVSVGGVTAARRTEGPLEFVMSSVSPIQKF